MQGGGAFSSGYSVPFQSSAASTLHTTHIKHRQFSKPQTTRDIHLQSATKISLYLPVSGFYPPFISLSVLKKDISMCV
jgi:hypothetical protein